MTPPLSLIEVRDRLNEQTYTQGVREALLGRVSELFGDRDAGALDRDVQAWSDELAGHELLLRRGADDPDELYVSQRLNYGKPDNAWMREAMQWVSRITTVAMEMVAPALVGYWLDQRLGTGYCALLGLAVGVPLGIWHLTRIAR